MDQIGDLIARVLAPDDDRVIGMVKTGGRSALCGSVRHSIVEWILIVNV